MTDTIKNDAHSASDIHGPPSARHKIRRFDAKDLFGSEPEVEIEFKAQVYRLRITRQDKLILTK